MHAGGMAECASQPNLMHIILNNGAHDSVGGQPTAAFNIDLQKIAEGFGYSNIIKATTALEIKSALDRPAAGSMFLRSAANAVIERTWVARTRRQQNCENLFNF